MAAWNARRKSGRSAGQTISATPKTMGRLELGSLAEAAGLRGERGNSQAGQTISATRRWWAAWELNPGPIA